MFNKPARVLVPIKTEIADADKCGHYYTHFRNLITLVNCNSDFNTIGIFEKLALFIVIIYFWFIIVLFTLFTDDRSHAT